MSRNTLFATALTAAFAAAIGLAAPAHALEAKQCLPMADMNVALKADGQRTMIIGDREALQNPTGKIENVDVLRFVNTVTSSADGSLGYQLEGDKPRAEPSNNVCVRAKLTNVRLFDASRSTIAKTAFLGGKFDDALQANDRLGTRPMVEADTLHRDANGNEVKGLPMVLLGNVADKAGHMVTRLADGQMQHLMQMTDVEYTPAALSRIGTQVAMREPQ